MPNHKLSKNIYPEKIFAVVQQIMVSQTVLTVLQYTIMMILLSLAKLPLLLFKGPKVLTPCRI
jgi:hypothetical protein